MKKCKQGYYYCYKDKKCKKIPLGYRIGLGGWLRKEKEEETEEGKKKNGNGNGANGNGNGNGESNGGSNGGGVSEAWSSKYKKSIDCDNPKGFSQRAHCRGRKKVSEEAVSRKQQKFFGIVRAIQKGELEPTTPETAKAARDMKKSDVKKFASTKHKGLPERKEVKEESNPRIPRKKGQPANSKKHSDLYTDENPKGTIHGLGFKNVATAKASVAKIKKSSRSHAHKIQAAVAMEQRAREMGKTSEAAVYRKFINSMKKKTKAMNEETCPICGCDPCQCLEGNITEARDGKSSKDKGYSLRDWFKGGGWKQTGGKYDGKPCAKQPGQKTKPYCRDADDRAAMSKEERNKRARKKRKEDPNPNRKGKAKNVTQESYSNWRQDLQEKPGDGYLGPTVKVGKKEYGVPNPIRIAQDAADNANRANQRKVDAVKAHGGTASMSPYKLYNKQTSTASQTLFGMQKQSYEPEGDIVNERSAFGGGQLRPYDNVRNLKGELINLNQIDAKIKANQVNNKKGVKEEYVEEGKKDACYHKVKSRYSVWPSAYASGALVKCRKVGAKNWGNKTKKESVDYSNWRDDFQALEIETIDLIKADPIEVPPSRIDIIKEGAKKKNQVRVTNVGDTLKKSVDNQIMTDPELKLIKKKFVDLDKAHYEPEGEVLDEKCWKGYEKKGMKTMFGKRYPNCVKKKKTRKEEFEVSEGKYTRGEIYKKGTAPHRDPVAGESYPKETYKKKVRLADEVEHIDEKINPLLKGILKKTPKGEDPKKGGVPYKITGRMTTAEAVNGGDNDPCWDTHKQVGMKKKGGKMVPNCVPKNEEYSNWRDELEEGAAWTKKEGKNKSGGLNEKGRKSYERENPGSDLKRPSKKVGNKRRKSFCARMKGMKKKLTSKKTANDPDSRINKSLRAWNC
jgi:hypothetical protein